MKVHYWSGIGQQDIISRYRNNLQINIKKVFEMMDTCKLQLLLTPQGSKVSAFGTAREHNNTYNKKRIGCYSYYLNECIGSGFSSQVYRGCKNDNKQARYAIKVIKMSRMNKGNYQLLQNQINILKKLDHPNIIKLHDVFYTENNCYLITDYCEGGTLQDCIKANTNIEWKQVFSQIVEGCKYLENNLIIHRDIKPVNIFLKGKQWKIGDFGFARYVPYKTAQVKQMYMIGSPLYMPPETLEKNIYSLKTDSFALGVLFFHLLTKQFPWSGTNKRQLIQGYAAQNYPLHKIKFEPDYMQRFLKGLCQIQISRRLYISDFDQLKLTDSGYSMATQTTINSSQDLVTEISSQISLDIVEQMKVCKFIFYIDLNIQHFPQMCEVSQNLRRMIKFFALAFGWNQSQSYRRYIDEFMCRNYKQFTKIEQLGLLQSVLQISIENLEGSKIRRCQILRIKLIQFADIIRCLIYRDFASLKISISKLVLHSDFSKVLISPAQINQIESLRQLYI